MQAHFRTKEQKLFETNRSKQLHNLLFFKNNTLGFLKIINKYVLLPVRCLWDKVKQLKYSVFMQNIPIDLHCYTSFQIVYLALYYYTTVGIQMWEAIIIQLFL